MYYEVNGGRLRILGTNHAVPEGRSIPPYVVDAAQWAEQVCIEHDSLGLRSRMGLNDGQRLEDLLPVGVWTPLHEAWNREPKIGMDLQRQRPWAAAMVVGVARLRCSPGAEDALAKHQSAQGKSLSHIEHADEFGDLLDAVPVAEVAEMLRASLPELANVQARFEETYYAWAMRDEAKLRACMDASPAFGSPLLKDAMLLARNRNWTDRVMRGEPTTKTLLAVGCYHLIGPGNLLDLLRQRGLMIRAL